MTDGERLWKKGEWLINRIAETKITARKKPLKRLLSYSADDYDVRKKGDHFESYNKITGESLFEAFSEKEAWADLREEFAV